MKKFIWLGLILFVAFIGCNLVDRDFSLAEDDFIDPNKGSLVLILDGGAIPTKTIAPTLSMDVTSYELIFRGPDVTVGDTSGSFTTTIGSVGLYSKSNLTPGTDWRVAANAYNADNPTPTLIGAIGGVEGTEDTFTIAAGETKDIVITVQPITSTTGTLDLTVT